MHRALAFLSLTLGAAQRWPKHRKHAIENHVSEHRMESLEVLLLALGGQRLRPTPDEASRHTSTVFANVRQLTNKADFDNAVNKDGLVVVDYGNTLCPSCNVMEPRFKLLSEIYPNAEFLKAISNDNLELEIVMALQGVKVWPTFDLFKRGQKVATVEGPKEEELKKAIEAHIR